MATLAFDVPAPTEKLDTPEPVAQTLNQILAAAASGESISQEVVDTLLAFCTTSAMGTGSRVLPDRTEGSGVFYHTPMPFSLKDFVAYTLNPTIPSSAILPNSVRHSTVVSGSMLERWKEFQTLPPNELLIAHAKEAEEITPDETSGSYYAYTLKRFIALAPSTVEAAGSTVLLMVSTQDAKSERGKKGALLGSDMDWNYVYTGEYGSTLPMVGWAETYIYDTATITLVVEPDGDQAYMYIFKWLKAGWSGMNVVKASHINEGIKRYLTGLVQILGSKNRPSPESIAARQAEIEAMSDADHLAALAEYSADLARLAKEQGVNGSDFDAVLAENTYAEHLTRIERSAELIKLFMKEKLGLPLTSATNN